MFPNTVQLILQYIDPLQLIDKDIIQLLNRMFLIGDLCFKRDHPFFFHR